MYTLNQKNYILNKTKDGTFLWSEISHHITMLSCYCWLSIDLDFPNIQHFFHDSSNAQKHIICQLNKLLVLI